MKIVVIPGGSNSGRACIDSLVDSNEANQITACVRTPKRTFPAEVKVISNVDASNFSALSTAFKDQDYALIVTPHDYSHGFQDDSMLTCNMIHEAADRGVTFIVLVGSFTVHNPKELSVLNGRFAAAEALLEELGRQTDLKWTVLRGGYFTSNLVAAWKQGIDSGSTIRCTQMTVAPIDTIDIGKCAARILLDGPKKHHGKCYEMNGPKLLTTQEIHAEIQRAIGKSYPYEIVRAREMVGVPKYLSEIMNWFEIAGSKATPYEEHVKELIGSENWTDVYTYFKRIEGDFK